MNERSSSPDELSDLRLLRPGAVARQLGMSVETLRAWEHRYGITSSQQSGGGQRLYSQDDLQRLGWIKKLVDAGHRIGQLAGLAPDALRALAASLPERAAAVVDAAPIRPLRLSLVGPWIASKAICEALAPQFNVVTAAASLDELDLAGFDSELLLLETAVLDSTLDAHLDNLRRSYIQAPIVVLYRFGSPETVRQLGRAGYQVIRKPMDGMDAAWLSELLRRLELPESAAAGGAVAALPLPRFSESDLATISAASQRLQCECPRHLAELLSALNGFERYSLQCAVDSTEESELHRTLSIAAGRARLLLEDGLQKLVEAKGIVLD